MLQPINLDIKSAAAYLGISRRYLDEMKCKRLDPDCKKLVRYVNISKRILFPIDELKRYSEQLQKDQWAKI